MTITLRPDQERVLVEAINSGLAHSTDEALEQALDALRLRLGRQAQTECVESLLKGLIGAVRQSGIDGFHQYSLLIGSQGDRHSSVFPFLLSRTPALRVHVTP